MDRGSKREAPKLEASGNKKRKYRKYTFWTAQGKEETELLATVPKDLREHPELAGYVHKILMLVRDRVNEENRQHGDALRQRFALYNKHHMATSRALIEELKKRARAQHDKLRTEFAVHYRTLFKTAQRNFELCGRQIEHIARLQQQNSALAQQVVELQRQLVENRTSPPNTGEQKGGRWI